MFWTSCFFNISLSKHHFLKNISCFERHVSSTFHVLNVTFLKYFIFRELCFLKHFMFRTSRFLNISCFKHYFLKNFMFWTSRFLNISCFKHYFLKNFMFWISHFSSIIFWKHFISCFELYVSETFRVPFIIFLKIFHVLNVTFLKHFMFWTSRFLNILCFDCHVF